MPWNRKKLATHHTMHFNCIRCGHGSTYEVGMFSGVYSYRSKRDPDQRDRVDRKLCVNCYNEMNKRGELHK